MNNKNFEQGRSMVEMLGVLAVMGILSVGGVAMYTNAMNKYRANELLNESSKRAVVIATQILSGKSVSSDMINQFDNNGTTFTGVEEVGTNQFKLTLSGVDDAVCTQLKATVGSNTIIQEVGDKCAFFTFNNDLSKGTSSSNTGGSNGGNEQQEPEPEPVDLCANVFCQHNGTCSNGVCDCAGTGYTGTYCETASGPYCSISGNCSVMGSGKNWNEANSICETNNMTLVSLQDLGCTTQGCSEYASVKSTLGGEWLTIWVSDTDASSSGNPGCSPLCHYDVDDGDPESTWNDIGGMHVVCKK